MSMFTPSQPYSLLSTSRRALAVLSSCMRYLMALQKSPRTGESYAFRRFTYACLFPARSRNSLARCKHASLHLSKHAAIAGAMVRCCVQCWMRAVWDRLEKTTLRRKRIPEVPIPRALPRPVARLPCNRPPPLPSPGVAYGTRSPWKSLPATQSERDRRKTGSLRPRRTRIYPPLPRRASRMPVSYALEALSVMLLKRSVMLLKRSVASALPAFLSGCHLIACLLDGML